MYIESGGELYIKVKAEVLDSKLKLEVVDCELKSDSISAVAIIDKAIDMYIDSLTKIGYSRHGAIKNIQLILDGKKGIDVNELSKYFR